MRWKMNKRLGVGIIGAGFIGRFHIRSWEAVRNGDINGICDKNIELANEAASIAKNLNLGNPKIYSSVSDIVAAPDIEAVWICTPNFTRLEVMEEIINTIESGRGGLIGVACEKPLGRNVYEARRMLELVQRVELLDGYLENQVFSPTSVRGKELMWTRGAKTSGRPYLARAAEEHGGPHEPWFWDGELQGGGVLSDMMCHSVEVARFMLTEPGKSRESLIPVKVTAHTECLKWQRPEYIKKLTEDSHGKTDYLNKPAEDYARSVIEYKDENNEKIIVETTTSWSYVGAGLRLSLEVLGPEYSLLINSLDTDMKLFLSREISGEEGEDFLEKQNAESGLMPIISNEENTYGYDVENRHMVDSFLNGIRPSENFNDGLNVTELLMTAYISAEEERTVVFPPKNLENYKPKVAKGEWNPKVK
jgi:predicted dehydrogenase